MTIQYQENKLTNKPQMKKGKGESISYPSKSGHSFHDFIKLRLFLVVRDQLINKDLQNIAPK